jgi:hypothetical protein
MGLNIAPFDRALWRIAELGSRCSDRSWPGDRDQAWAALQEAVGEARSMIMAASAALDAAETRAARAEGRTKVAQAERDRERESVTALQAKTKAAQTAAVSGQSRAEKAEADREAAIEAKDAAVDALRRAMAERDDAIAARASAAAERDMARAAAQAAERARQHAVMDRAEAMASLEAAEAVKAKIPAKPKTATRAKAKAAVAVEGPVAVDVSNGTNEEVAAEPAMVDLTGEPASEMPVAAMPASENAGGYLHVAATMSGLLPDDFGDLLVPGASVIRREGRLAALITVPAPESAWAPPAEAAEEQAERLRSAGFRVQWVNEICVAS